MPIPPRLPDPNAAAHERLYRTLRQQVMHGELPPGQALTLRGLGRQFGVSMTPAREAVRRLENVNRSELLGELQRAGYVRPNDGPLDESYCRIELTDMTKRGYLRRVSD